MRKHKFKAGGGSKGGREQWWLLVLSAVEICQELQSRAPPHITAAGLTQLRGNPSKNIQTSPKQDHEQKNRKNEEVNPVRYTEEVRRKG